MGGSTSLTTSNDPAELQRMRDNIAAKPFLGSDALLKGINDRLAQLHNTSASAPGAAGAPGDSQRVAKLKGLLGPGAAVTTGAPQELDLLDAANTAAGLTKRRQQLQAGAGLDSTFLGTPNAPGKTLLGS